MARSKKASDSLATYRKKRDFTRSPEPTGGAPKSAGKDRFFCVQKHLASHLHYDFRLELHGVLLSWAVPKGPSLNPRDKRLAMQVEDHPFDYRDFEGVIPEGYGAGIVMLWDKGTWRPELSDDVDAALRAGELKFTLDGVKLKGSWVLVRTKAGPRNDAGESRSWLLIKHRDNWAGAVDVAKAAPLSVKSFGDFDDILAADHPDIWNSHLPAKGGEAGALLRDIIDKAAKKKLARSEGKSAEPTRAKTAEQKRAKPVVQKRRGASAKKSPARSKPAPPKSKAKTPKPKKGLRKAPS